MKLSLHIDESVLEDRIQIDAHKRTRQIEDLIDYVKQMEEAETLTVRKGENMNVLAVQNIYRIFIESRVLKLSTKKETFTSPLRLYQAREVLPRSFLQISQSEIINSRYLDYLTLTPNGLVKLTMKNGEVTYSSRRYLKKIKEAFKC